MTFNKRYAKEEKKTFSPPEGVQAAARKALKWIEEGHAGSGFTGVGRGRAHQLANGEAVSLSTIKRMHSFFSRHRVDKQGKDWNKPSPGKVAWYAWGGDAGASWAAGIAEKNDSKKKEASFDERYASEKMAGDPHLWNLGMDVARGIGHVAPAVGHGIAEVARGIGHGVQQVGHDMANMKSEWAGRYRDPSNALYPAQYDQMQAWNQQHQGPNGAGLVGAGGWATALGLPMIKREQMGKAIADTALKVKNFVNPQGKHTADKKNPPLVMCPNCARKKSECKGGQECRQVVLEKIRGVDPYQMDIS